MYILDKNKDYYDYLAKLYGVDKTIVYDRRGSVPLTELSFLRMAPDYGDYNKSQKYISGVQRFLFIVEIGFTQYLFEMHDIKYDNTEYHYPVSCNYELVRVFRDNKHYYEKEIAIVRVTRGFNSNWRDWNKKEFTKFNELKVIPESKISNPILKDTIIPSYIKAIEVWGNLSNYISSKYNDKTITIINSDVDKLQNHGFDKVVSFRNPTKL